MAKNSLVRTMKFFINFRFIQYACSTSIKIRIYFNVTPCHDLNRLEASQYYMWVAPF